MHKQIKDNIVNLLKYKNHPNICLYGYINDINIFDIFKNIYTNINNNTLDIYKNIEYVKNNVYIQFDLKHIKYKNKDEWIIFIKDICNTYNIINDRKKIIILKNFQYINIHIQNILKVIIEKNTHVTFIILSNKYDKIIQPIKSRFLCIRLPEINYKEKYNNVKNIIKIDDYIKYYKDYNLSDIKYFNYNNIMIKNDILNIISKYINDIINSNCNNYLKYIKDLSYYILNISIPFNVILIEIINMIFINNLINNEIKYKILSYITEAEYKYTMSYYKMIHIESVFLELSNILKST